MTKVREEDYCWRRATAGKRLADPILVSRSPRSKSRATKCEGILRSTLCTVKPAKDPFTQVILVISSERYKRLSDFIIFARNKNYDGFKITRY